MTYDVVANLMRLKGAGPKPFFNEVHIIRFLELCSSRHHGRKEISASLLIGEGSVRTMIKLLRSEGLIEIRRAGVRLSEKGSELLSSLGTQFSRGVEVPAGRSFVDRCNVAIRVMGAAMRAGSGIRQRDAALLVGASGASTFKYLRTGLTFPGMYEDLSSFDPELSSSIISNLDPRVGDAVVVGSAAEVNRAHLGAIAAATTLL